MKYWLFLATVFLAWPLSAPGQASAIAEDAAITARVETTLVLNEHLNPFNINTTTQDGVVTLTGGVNDDVQKQLAEELARSAKGVKDVKNDITVVPAAYSDKDRRNFRQKIVDKTTTAGIKANLLYNSEFHGLKIGVETVNGVSTLHGNVFSEEQKKRIEEIAFNTRGVEKVINNMTVYTPEAKDDAIDHMKRQFSDEWLETRITTSLTLNRHISIRELDVEVDDGICFLSGNVDSEAEKQVAEKVAASLQGVSEVRNNIAVRSSGVEIPAPPSQPQVQEAEPADVEPLDSAETVQQDIQVEQRPLDAP